MAPRVLVLTGAMQRVQAGAGQAVIHLVNALASRYPGDVAVGTFAHEPDLLHDGVRIIELKLPPAPRFFWRFTPIIAIRRCYHAMKAARVPAAGFCYTPSTAMALAYRRLHPSVPIVSHTGAVLWDREIREESTASSLVVAICARLARHFEQSSYREPNWRHVVSTRLVAQQRQDYFGLPPDFFAICPYGLDLARFDLSARHEDMRARYGIPNDAFLLVSVARLVRWKNHDMILQAIAKADEEPWLFVVGTGPEEDRLKALARELRVDHRVRFVGHVDPAPFLASSDLFVLPSSIESFGLAYAEAMSMGLPCIGLRNRPPDVLSSAQDVIPEGTAGYCVDDVDELRAQIDRLARSPETVRALGAFAYKLATSAYTTERYVACLQQLDRGAERAPPGLRRASARDLRPRPTDADVPSEAVQREMRSGRQVEMMDSRQLNPDLPRREQGQDAVRDNGGAGPAIGPARGGFEFPP